MIVTPLRSTFLLNHDHVHFLSSPEGKKTNASTSRTHRWTKPGDKGGIWAIWHGYVDYHKLKVTMWALGWLSRFHQKSVSKRVLYHIVAGLLSCIWITTCLSDQPLLLLRYCDTDSNIPIASVLCEQANIGKRSNRRNSSCLQAIWRWWNRTNQPTESKTCSEGDWGSIRGWWIVRLFDYSFYLHLTHQIQKSHIDKFDLNQDSETNE